MLTQSTVRSFTDGFYLMAADQLRLAPIQEGAQKSLYDTVMVEHRPLFSYTAPFIDLSTRTINFAATPPPLRRENESEKEKAKRATWIGAAVGVVGLALTGFFWSSFWNARKVCAITSEIASQVPKDSQDPIWEDFQKLVDAKQESETRKYSKARSYLVGSVTLLAGASCLVLGGLKVVMTLIKIGFFVVAAGGAVLIFCVAAHWSDGAKDRHLYLTIVGNKQAPGLHQRIHNQLHAYDENMKGFANPPPVQAYVPAFVQPEAPPPPYNPNV